MQYAVQNEQLCALKKAADTFREKMLLYYSYTSRSFDGLDGKEHKSLAQILTLLAELDKEFDKWDFDNSRTERPYRNGKAAPVLKEYLKY